MSSRPTGRCRHHVGSVRRATDGDPERLSDANFASAAVMPSRGALLRGRAAPAACYRGSTLCAKARSEKGDSVKSPSRNASASQSGPPSGGAQTSRPPPFYGGDKTPVARAAEPPSGGSQETPFFNASTARPPPSERALFLLEDVSRIVAFRVRVVAEDSHANPCGAARRRQHRHVGADPEREIRLHLSR